MRASTPFSLPSMPCFCLCCLSHVPYSPHPREEREREREREREACLPSPASFFARHPASHAPVMHVGGSSRCAATVGQTMSHNHEVRRENIVNKVEKTRQGIKEGLRRVFKRKDKGKGELPPNVLLPARSQPSACTV